MTTRRQVLFAGFGVGAPLQSPLPIPLCARRLRPAEHIQARRVPVVEGLLHPLLCLAAFGRELRRAGRAEVDVAGFLLHHARGVL